MKSMFFYKKGDLELSKLAKALIALALLVILLGIVMAVKGKNETVLAMFEGIRNFGGLLS